MKHQITFVGGQLLPVFVGIKEFSPSYVHFIVSKESETKVEHLKLLLNDKKYSVYICNPFEFTEIRNTCIDIITKFKDGNEIQFNLTGGTKIMVLAAQTVIQERNLTGFYINQNGTQLHLPTYTIDKISCIISIKEFLEISGHKLNRFKTINDFTMLDFESVEVIDRFSINHSNILLQINNKLRKTYENKIPLSGTLEINKSCSLIWTSKSIQVKQNNVEIFNLITPNARSLFFYASWWELIVAKEISQWGKAKELLIQCELPFKSDTLTTKNEIDILINLGDRLIFIECKSGTVKQDDVYKMSVVKDTYGGIISKTILVCRFKPLNNIIEKCNELNIGVFYLFDDKTEINNLEDLKKELDKVEFKLSL